MLMVQDYNVLRPNLTPPPHNQDGASRWENVPPGGGRMCNQTPIITKDKAGLRAGGLAATGHEGHGPDEGLIAGKDHHR